MNHPTEISSSFFDIPFGFMIQEKNSWKFSIEFPIVPFIFCSEETKTSVRLRNVDFKTGNLKHLSNKSFYFPTNPHAGYIDGSVYLENIHNAVDVTKISFSKILPYSSISIVSANLEMNFLFEVIGLKNVKKVLTTNIIIHQCKY